MFGFPRRCGAWNMRFVRNQEDGNSRRARDGAPDACRPRIAMIHARTAVIRKRVEHRPPAWPNRGANRAEANASAYAAAWVRPTMAAPGEALHIGHSVACLSHTRTDFLGEHVRI